MQSSSMTRSVVEKREVKGGEKKTQSPPLSSFTNGILKGRSTSTTVANGTSVTSKLHYL